MSPRAAGAPRLPYMPGVDGLRAVAVAAVVTYHIGASWLPGGFLGVNVFLVISGYLITSLLLAERRATGTHRRGAVLDPARPPAPPRPLRDDGPGPRLHGRRPPRRGRSAARRHARVPRVRRQLVLRLRRPAVLRPVRPAVGVPSPVVAGGRGAVLPALAADHGARDRLVRAPAAAGRGPGGDRRLHDPGLGALRALRRPLADLLRHRHAGRLPARRGGARLPVAGRAGCGP